MKKASSVYLLDFFFFQDLAVDGCATLKNVNLAYMQSFKILIQLRQAGTGRGKFFKSEFSRGRLAKAGLQRLNGNLENLRLRKAGTS